MKEKGVKFILLALLLELNLFGRPKPGDIYRDYYWTTGDFEQEFLRVIGDGDYRDPVHFSECYPKDKIKDGWIKIDEIDLDKAVRAEIQVEKLLSHDGTKNLSVKVNDSDWMVFPESDSIPYPQWNYLYLNYPVVEIPLEHLAEKTQVRFKVDSTQRFGMPQNILYGFSVRIYYSDEKTHAYGEIDGLDNKNLKLSQNLALKNMHGNIKSVKYIGLYKDVNYQSDGIYRQWQYTYNRGEMEHHIGESNRNPYEVTWQTGWIPNQNKPLEVAALIEDQDGIIYFTESVKGLQLERNFDVLLCKPFNIPTLWATREGVFTENSNCPRNPKKAEAFQLVWSSWSPGYMNGLYLNEWVMATRFGENYVRDFHRLTFDKCHYLYWGTNTIRTAKTPNVFGNMVHGTEMLYPGVMTLVKFPKQKKEE